MDRPRRAAAAKPPGHYAATTTSTKRKKADTATASARKKGKQRADPTAYGMGSRTPAPLPSDASLPIPVITPDPLDPAALALDLNKSYEDQITPPVWPKRQQRWKNPTGNPIRFMEDTPIGWNSDEPDLDPHDLEAQIARCHERISDNIMPHQFDFKLRNLLLEQKSRENMMALEPAGLSWPVVQRLQSLKGTLEWLQSEDDKYELAANVTNIMAAYRSGQLRWTPGLVTYWSRGTRLCHPRPFRWDEFDIINDQNTGSTGFWVEGLQGPGPVPQLFDCIAKPLPGDVPFRAYMNITIRIPDANFQAGGGAFNPLRSVGLELPFVDDSGASVMQINESDIRYLMSLNRDPQQNDPPPPPVLGALQITVANGVYYNLVCRRLAINMWDPKTGNYMSPAWHPVQVVVHDDTNSTQQLRLNGPWPRHRMYTSSAPDGLSNTYFTDIHPSQSLTVPWVHAAQMAAHLPDFPVQPVGRDYS
ncbi:hypothetical protein VN97_g3564 [Penicillium thymicola]|uniref:Uncharacterized protein n=1 Tax=Penicillium thymicola TaxID=293382 RepID=A0AAI9TND2_PENTH|nr:hypothetical protein VN97_g3564 [Penicillium thymicola]